MSGTVRGALLFAGVVAVTGFRVVDVLDLMQLHANPFQRLEEVRSYLHSSMLNVFVGHAVRANSPGRIAAMYLTATALALGAVLLYGHRAIGDSHQRWTFFRLLALSPLLHVLLFWVGKSDPFLVGAYMLLLLARHPVAVGALSLVLTLAHPEQATVVLAVHTLLQRPGPAPLVAHFAGWAAALGMQQAYIAQLGIVGSPRAAWLAGRLLLPVRINLIRPVTMTFLSFSWFWLPVLVHVKRRPGWTLPALAGTCIAVAASSVDYTRIFTLLALPMTVHVARELAREDGSALRPWLGRLTVLAFLQMELASGQVWENAWLFRLLRALAR